MTSSLLSGLAARPAVGSSLVRLMLRTAAVVYTNGVDSDGLMGGVGYVVG